MSPLAGFLIFVVSFTGIAISYLIKQEKKDNIFYSNKTLFENTNLGIKKL
tara:strand:+ start:81 stop:230 length:150 start_codon:yes stop_codon:yes gene_type:complete